MKTRTRKQDAPIDPEAVAKRAYALFLERGSEPGREIEDWLEAERQIRTEKKPPPKKPEPRPA